jgi:hypothetical protein
LSLSFYWTLKVLKVPTLNAYHFFFKWGLVFFLVLLSTSPISTYHSMTNKNLFCTIPHAYSLLPILCFLLVEFISLAGFLGSSFRYARNVTSSHISHSNGRRRNSQVLSRLNRPESSVCSLHRRDSWLNNTAKISQI